jgi:hypothetical protein
VQFAGTSLPDRIATNLQRTIMWQVFKEVSARPETEKEVVAHVRS